MGGSKFSFPSWHFWQSHSFPGLNGDSRSTHRQQTRQDFSQWNLLLPFFSLYSSYDMPCSFSISSILLLRYARCLCLSLNLSRLQIGRLIPDGPAEVLGINNDEFSVAGGGDTWLSTTADAGWGNEGMAGSLGTGTSSTGSSTYAGGAEKFSAGSSTPAASSRTTLSQMALAGPSSTMGSSSRRRRSSMKASGGVGGLKRGGEMLGSEGWVWGRFLRVEGLSRRKFWVGERSLMTAATDAWGKLGAK